MFRAIWKKKVFIVFVLLLVIMLPYAATRPAQMISKSLLTSVGLDRVDGKLELTGEMIVNQFSQSGEQKSAVISESGATVNEILNKISSNQGREISFAHCTLMVIGGGLRDEDLATELSYFLHRTEINNNCALIYTEDKMKELFELSVKDGNSQGGLLHQVIKFNQDNVLGKPTSLERFYKDYFRAGSSGLMGIIKGGESIQNNNESAVFRSGKYIFSLSTDETNALNFLNSKGTKIRRYVEFDDTNCVLLIKSKKNSIETKIENGLPYVRVNIKTTAKIEEVTDTSDPARFLDIDNKPPIEEIGKHFAAALKADLTTALETVKQNKTDFLQFYELFYSADTKNFKDYMKGKTVNELLENLTFVVEVDAKII